MRRLFPALMAALTLLAITSPAYADGIIIPEPPICDPGPCPQPIPLSALAIKYHRVTVTIDHQVAVTRVDQVFRNDQSTTVEGTYIFPLPAGAAVTSFTMWVDGQPVEGKVLSREEARRVYEDIVRQLRDPALLEYVDHGAVQASIFPIEPGGERRIQLEYTQVLASEGGLIRYLYPLNTEKFSTQPLEQVSVNVEVRSDDPIRAIYSPSHPIEVTRMGDDRFQASYEDEGVTPNQDFELYYSVAQGRVGLSLLTYRNPEDDDRDGYFLLLAAPGIEVEPRLVIGRDVFIVLDQSGSMEGEKLEQAKSALRYILDHLNREDRFNIIAFNSSTRAYADGLRPADEASQASRWVDTIAARGSTDINRALLEAASQSDAERPALVIFLTDGLPTAGVTDSPAIIEQFAEAAPSSLRLFAFGVGYDVDTILLDSLAQGHHGTTTYVTPGQAIDEAVSGFYAKVSTPVLTDLSIDLGDVGAYDLYPDPLPDLFAGSQLVLVGRYRHAGGATIRLTGRVEGETQSLGFPDQTFRASGGPDFLPRLWATRKVGALLNQIRLQGAEKEVVDQIVRLSIRYGIVTPYTSYLVTEPSALGAEAQGQIASDAYKQMLAAPTQAAGQAAVERAAGESALGGAQAPVAPSGEAANVVRLAGARTFTLVDGVWVDTAFDPQTMTTKRVPFASSDYFALAAAREDLAAAFALGPRVIALSDGVAYEVVASDEPGDVIEVPPAETTQDPAGLPPAATAEPAQAPRPSSGLPCPGAALALGLAVLPAGRLIRRRRAS